MSENYLPIRPDKYTATPWQLEDLAYLADKPYSANFSEMGCYKTSTAAWLLDHKIKPYLAAGIPAPVLIITTKSGKGTYFDAIPKCLTGYKVYNVNTKAAEEVVLGMFRFKTDPKELFSKIAANEIGSPTIVLAHYNCFTNKAKIKELLQGITWGMIIVDEAHRLKNRDTQWTRNIKLLNTIDGQKHIMTGTGFINRPDEIWSLLHFLSPKTFGSYWRFRRYFCDEVKISGFTKVIGLAPDKIEEFRTLRKHIGVRREMAEVHSSIDKPIPMVIDVELNPTQRKMYNEIKNDLKTMDQNGLPIHSPNVLSALNRMRQICVATPEKIDDYYDEKLERRVQTIRLTEPSSKLDALMEFLEGLEWDDENKQQVVVFSCFKDPLELLKVRLDTAEISYLHMRSEHNEKDRYKMWHDTFPLKQHQVFMSTLQLGSESINLTPAQYAVFLDRSWSPKDNAQAIGRIYRPGQTKGCVVCHINANRTTDQRIEKSEQTKLGWFRTIFGADDEQ